MQVTGSWYFPLSLQRPFKYHGVVCYLRTKSTKNTKFQCSRSRGVTLALFISLKVVRPVVCPVGVSQPKFKRAHTLVRLILFNAQRMTKKKLKLTNRKQMCEVNLYCETKFFINMSWSDIVYSWGLFYHTSIVRTMAICEQLKVRT